MKQLTSFLKSLTIEERDFIAGLDYGDGAKRHRTEIDRVIECGGHVDLKSQYWYPYEVIELGKNQLKDGHEREFVACAGIVLQNILTGVDRMNDWEISLATLSDVWVNLERVHQEILEPFVMSIMEKSEV